MLNKVCFVVQHLNSTLSCGNGICNFNIGTLDITEITFTVKVPKFIAVFINN